MDWYDTVFEVIDMRSFSNLWYWIGLAVIWSTASHWVLGVPYDMVQRARRKGEQAAVDLEDMVRISCNRLLYIGQVSGLWMLAIGCALITGLVLLGFWYGVEFAQALFFFVFPLSIIGLLSMSTARLITDEGSSGELLYKRLGRHRLYTQIIGMTSVFVTAMWGMYQNLAVGPLGG
ncbi:MAG: component of SufBCD complex [Paracoccaceae bacterium]